MCIRRNLSLSLAGSHLARHISCHKVRFVIKECRLEMGSLSLLQTYTSKHKHFSYHSLSLYLFIYVSLSLFSLFLSILYLFLYIFISICLSISISLSLFYLSFSLTLSFSVKPTYAHSLNQNMFEIIQILPLSLCHPIFLYLIRPFL